MADSWHGYVMLERVTANLNQGNFDTLRDAFRAVTPVEPGGFPAYIMHTRANIAEDKEIFECKFAPADVEVQSFKQFMATLFGQDVENIEDEILETVSYSGGGRETRRWGFNFPVAGARRLEVVRFGRGGTWLESLLETTAYFLANIEEWE